MAKARNQFVCQQCGATFPKWTGRCENCGEWNSLVEQVSEATGASVVAKNARTGTALAGVKLDEATPEPKSIRLHTGIADLDSRAGGSYRTLGWEDQRVAILRQIETTPFFQKIRSEMVTGLYNQPEIWPIFGYEGESYSKGGYIHRGFDDIDWL